MDGLVEAPPTAVESVRATGLQRLLLAAVHEPEQPALLDLDPRTAPPPPRDKNCPKIISVDLISQSTSLLVSLSLSHALFFALSCLVWSCFV